MLSVHKLVQLGSGRIDEPHDSGAIRPVSCAEGSFSRKLSQMLRRPHANRCIEASAVKASYSSISQAIDQPRFKAGSHEVGIMYLLPNVRDVMSNVEEEMSLRSQKSGAFHTSSGGFSLLHFLTEQRCYEPHSLLDPTCLRLNNWQ